MASYHREEQYLQLLSQREHTIKELASLLFISEPTVRRDIAWLRAKDLVLSSWGTVTLKTNSAEKRVPMFIRDMEHKEKKQQIAGKAARRIKDGDVIMLDASTTTYCLLPYLAEYKNLYVITSGAKTAVALATMGIRTLCIGGEMALESFSYVGPDAERTLRNYNADIAFFSCRGLAEDGVASDCSIQENTIRRIMLENSRESWLLCDSSKIGNRFLHTLCKKEELTGILTDDT